MAEALTATPEPRGSAASARGRRLGGAAIASVATALPERTVTNAAIAARLGVSGDWIESRTGIRERRIASSRETLTDIAALAGERAVIAAGADPTELDIILVATLTAERRLPNAAPLVADRLGATGAAAIDIGAACTGFVASLGLATGQVEAGRARSALVIGAENLSTVTDPGDKRTAGLFGDGAGAVLVRAGERARISPVVSGSDGSASELITLQRHNGYIRMNGHDTFRHAVARLSEATVGALAAAGRELPGVDLFVYHQANGRILAAVAEQLGLDPERVADYIARFGNTSAASIPIALAQAEADGRLWPGAIVLVAGFGSGLTWAATTLEWGERDEA